MSKVMVDNWFMEEIVKDIQNNKTYNSDSYSDLLMAIVLWDEVFYPQNKYNWWNSFPSQIQNILQPIDDEIENNLNESIKLFFEYKNISDDDYIWYKWKDVPNEEDIVGSGAIRYMMLSNYWGCDYLPCKKRQDFLLKYYGPERMMESLSRIRMQNYFDKQVEAYYMETYKMFIQEDYKPIKMPVLTKFICDNTPNGMLPVDYAFHLKNEGPVIKYRQYLDELQDALETHNLKELRFLINCSNDAVSDVMSLDRNNIVSIDVNILPLPSFSSSISMNFSKIYKKNNFHLTFLRDLTEYAINKII